MENEEINNTTEIKNLDNYNFRELMEKSKTLLENYQKNIIPSYEIKVDSSFNAIKNHTEKDEDNYVNMKSQLAVKNQEIDEILQLFDTLQTPSKYLNLEDKKQKGIDKFLDCYLNNSRTSLFYMKKIYKELEVGDFITNELTSNTENIDIEKAEILKKSKDVEIIKYQMSRLIDKMRGCKIVCVNGNML